MDNKNSKSESYVIREAENVINHYLRDREMCDIKNYYQLKEKYQRLKILSIVVGIISILTTLFHVIFK